MLPQLEIMSRVLTVFGATGAQGGSVVRAISKHSRLAEEYKIRAVTRDVAKPAAKALEKQGIDVIQVRRIWNCTLSTILIRRRTQADLDDKASVFKARSGSYAVFGVTNCKKHLCTTTAWILIARQFGRRLVRRLKLHRAKP